MATRRRAAPGDNTYRCPTDSSEHPHGNSSTCYLHGCKCDDCCEAARERQFWYRNMKRAGKYKAPVKVPSRGVHRRIRALATMGWSCENVGELAGVSGARVRQWMQADTVSIETHDLVAAVFAELWSKRAPVTAHTARTVNRARRFGWPGPLHWDDIDTDPEPVTLTRDTDRAGWVIDELDMLREAGESASSAVRKLRRGVGATSKLAYRYGRPDLGRWLEEAA